MIVNDLNSPSIKGVLKAGFLPIAKIIKKKIFGINTYYSSIKVWRYYNHAAIPTTAPHETPDVSFIKNGSIWNLNGKRPFFARWTTDYDCKRETGWWFIIKDNPYEPALLPSIKRRHIRKSRENFIVKIINPTDYSEQLADVCEDAFKGYPEVYKPDFNREKYISNIGKCDLKNLIYFAAFDKNTNEFSGFLVANLSGKCIDLQQLKTKRAAEKLKVNFALIDAFLQHFNSEISTGNSYILNNERNLVHETQFPEFLCRYFGFRKAYCRLHMAYPWYVKPHIYMFYLFRRYIESIRTKHPLLYKISAVLQMEDIARKCRKMK